MKDDTISRKAALNAFEKIDCSDGVGISSLKCDAVDDAVTAIKALPSAQQWIPCSERLPEKDGEYLTTTEDGLCDVESYGDGEWFYDDVVAWMPLPEPWKGEKNG